MGGKASPGLGIWALVAKWDAFIDCTFPADCSAPIGEVTGDLPANRLCPFCCGGSEEYCSGVNEPPKDGVGG